VTKAIADAVAAGATPPAIHKLAEFARGMAQ